MQIVETPSFRDIFKEDPPSLNALIEDIPSNVIITFLSFINAQLFLSLEGKQSQIGIWQLITRRFPEKLRREIFSGIYPFIEKQKDGVIIFATWHITEFIQHELINYREFDFTDTTPEQELRLFKAYFIVAETLNDRMSATMIEEMELTGANMVNCNFSI
jgi:hypothetical protein